MKVFVYETNGQYRQGDVKIIFADSKAEAKNMLLDDERKEFSDLPDLTDDAILGDWILVKEEKPVSGILWKVGGSMMA